MAKATVSQILTQIASTVNQEATAPTEGGSEWSLWLQFLNRAMDEWVNANDWESTKKYFYPSVSGMSTASIAMPGDFRKLAGEPVLFDGSISTGTLYPEIRDEQSGMYGINDKYFHTTGNLSNGFTLVLHPATLASGASLQVMYYSFPTSLASNAEIPLTSDPQFLVERTIAYVFEARSDPRFQIVEQKARERLLGMVENANLEKFNSYAGSSPVINDTQRQGFRFGRD